MTCLTAVPNAYRMQTIQELSKNSKHHANEQRKAAQAEQRIMSLKEKASKVIPAELSKLQKIMNGRMAELEATRDLSRTWLHVDMVRVYFNLATNFYVTSHFTMDLHVLFRMLSLHLVKSLSTPN